MAHSVGCMLGHCLAPKLLVALVAAGLVAPLAWPGTAMAQEAIVAPCRLCGPDSDAARDSRPAVPLRLEVQTRLEFDKVVFGGFGEALVALTPDGIATMSGAAAATGARAMPGSVLIRGEPGR